MASSNVEIRCIDCEATSFKDSAISGCKICVVAGIVTLSFVTVGVMVWTLFIA